MSDCAQLNLIKSIGNIAPKDSQVLVEKLLSCALNKENSMQIRVTSIESLRKFPSSSFASSIEKLIKNDEEDNEHEYKRESHAELGRILCLFSVSSFSAFKNK